VDSCLCRWWLSVGICYVVHNFMSSPLLDIPFRLPTSGLGIAGLFMSPGKWQHMNRLIPEYVLIFVRTGALHIQEEERPFVIQPGEAILLHANRRHFGTSDESYGLTYFWLHFSLRGDAPEHRDMLLQVPQHTQVARPDRLETLFRLYIGDAVVHRTHPLTESLLICQILCELSQSSLAERNEEPEILATQAAAYIRSHLQDQLSTSVVADAIACNPKYLSRIYHQVYGETLTQSIHKIRIEYAKHSLIETTMTVAEIAHGCGFELTSYFNRIFRRSTGMTPSEFRQTFGRLFLNSL